MIEKAMRRLTDLIYRYKKIITAKIVSSEDAAGARTINVIDNDNSS